MDLLGGRTVLLAGGTGEVGEGIARSLLAAKAVVVVPSRSPERLERLRELVGGGRRLITLAGDLGDPGGASELGARIDREVGGLDAAIASIGGWWEGPRVVDLQIAEWRRIIDSSLTAHVVAAQTLLPRLAGRQGASYTLINGGGALTAVPNSGPVSVSAAAQLMLKDVLVAEHRDDGPRINAVVLDTPVVTRSRSDGPAHWLRADDVGRYLTSLVAAADDGPDGETIVLRSPEHVRELLSSATEGRGGR